MNRGARVLGAGILVAGLLLAACGPYEYTTIQGTAGPGMDYQIQLMARDGWKLDRKEAIGQESRTQQPGAGLFGNRADKIPGFSFSQEPTTTTLTLYQLTFKRKAQASSPRERR